MTVYGAARSYSEHIPTFKALSIVFNSETKLIDLTMFEERQDVAVPLSLQFQYCPSRPFTKLPLVVTSALNSFTGSGESFKVARNDNVQAPMDFAIVTCWKVISIPFLHTL